MKTITVLKINVIACIISLLLLLFLFSCQKEENIIINNPDSDKNIITNIPLKNLIFRVTQNPTSIDNVLDKSNCVSINLPVGVYIGGSLYSVGSTTGLSYSEVQNIINQQPVAPTVVMNFPIIVTHQDYSVLQIANQTEMNSILDSCTDNGLADIRCAKINYPVTVATYNTNSQALANLYIQSNQQFYTFLANRFNDDVVANITYPITMIGSDNLEHLINSDQELEIFIQTTSLNCN